MVVAKLKEGHYENFLVFPFLLAIDGLYSLPIVPLLWWTMALHCCIQQSKTLNHLSTMSDSRVTILLVVFLASVGGLSPSIIIALRSRTSLRGDENLPNRTLADAKFAHASRELPTSTSC